jgi:hypothetical protein
VLRDAPAVPRSICITKDVGLRRALRRTLNSVGAEVEFCDDPTGAELADAHILFIDGEVWRRAGVADLLERLSGGGKLVVLGESIEDDEVVTLLRNERLDHVIGNHDGHDDGELLITSVKLLSGDLFGLEKYLAWGVKVHEIEVDSYDAKRDALTAVEAKARQVGARRSLVARIAGATDELLMNAIYNAPAAREGGSTSSRMRRATGDGLTDEPALLRFACDGRNFAVSVQDNYGELHKRAILDHLMRARNEQGRPKLAERGGAGLGLYFIMSSATRFIANIAPKQLTEVICLFDLDQSGARAPTCARSIHIFTSNGLGRAA